MKGNLLLVVDDYHFARKKTTNSRVYWECKDRIPLNCHAKVTHDIVNKKFIFDKDFKHCHKPCLTRRKTGELKKLRKMFGMDEPPKRTVKSPQLSKKLKKRKLKNKE
ncbi:hypothetical protein ACKWTF_011508 [Chironomus riparius]